jgi:hypothetical protein
MTSGFRIHLRETFMPRGQPSPWTHEACPTCQAMFDALGPADTDDLASYGARFASRSSGAPLAGGT